VIFLWNAVQRYNNGVEQKTQHRLTCIGTPYTSSPHRFTNQFIPFLLFASAFSIVVYHLSCALFIVPPPISSLLVCGVFVVCQTITIVAYQ
jgi:ABC-type multidrug transport system permease subunit